MSPFEDRYAKLNKEQKEAVDTLDGPVIVIAGPGTGKTEILTMRIANLLREKKAPPEKILALTFTESGAVSMRRRLTELIGADAYRVELSTFHGFANRIIQDYPDHFPSIVGATSITEIDQVEIMRALIDTPSLGLAKLRPFGDAFFYLKDILRAIDELKRQGVSPKAFAVIAAEEKEEFYANPDLYNTSGKYEGKMKGKYDAGAKRIEKNLELVRVYEGYEKALRAAKQYDYGDMIMRVADALEGGHEDDHDHDYDDDSNHDDGHDNDDDLRRALQDAYDYFLVDEHQDTNDAQNKIVECLATSQWPLANSAKKTMISAREDASPSGYSPLVSGFSPNLFVVGDEKQAIFRFQGASLENFHYFERRYPGVKLISLRDNYRSTQAILNAAQAVSPREAELTAHAGNPERPANLAVLSAPEVEHYFIGEKIKELLNADVAPEEIAVLYRDNKDAAPLARMLEKLRVPSNVESDQDVLSDLEIKKLLRILRAVQHFGSDVWLAEALHVDFLDIPPIDAYRLMSFAGKNRGKIKIYDILGSEALLKEAGVGSKETCLALFKSLSRWRRTADNASAADAFEMIVRESGFLAAILKHPSGSEKLAKLHALFDLLKSFALRRKNDGLREFLAHLDLIEEHGVAVKGRDAIRLPGRVRLMTAHHAKGMEFDYVFIMHAVDRKWGSRFRREGIRLPKKIYRMAGDDHDRNDDDDLDNDDDADGRNVFYVALTRARKELFVTLAKADREGKEQLPVRFITELKPDILTPYDVAPYEADFGAHRAEIEFAPRALKKPELEDKVFLNGLFEAQGISVTALNNYLECPWAYFYRNLVRIPEAPNKHLSFGNAVHAALKSYFDEFDDGNDGGKAYLVRRFEEALVREPIVGSEYEEALAKGRKALLAFYDEYHAGWAPDAVNEMRIDGIALADGTKIDGKLDRIEFLGDGNARVIDYKTGRPKTRNEIAGNTRSSDGDYKRQLVFYRLLLDKKGDRVMTSGVIQFIEPDERGKFRREEFEVMPGEVKVLEKQIESVADEIRSLSFWDKGCHEKDCKYCELRQEMGAPG